MTDNAGNVYSGGGVARSVLSTNDMVDIWYAPNSKAGATTLTITPNPSGTKGAALIWEFSGADTVSPLDQTAVLSSQNATATPTGAAVKTAVPEEVIVSVVVPGGSISGLYSGNAFTGDSLFFGTGWAHLIAQSLGTYSARWNTSSGSYASSTASFKASVASQVTTPNSIAIPSGSTSAQFTVTAGSIQTSQNVIVSATLNAASKSATISLSAPSGSNTAKVVVAPGGSSTTQAQKAVPSTSAIQAATQAGVVPSSTAAVSSLICTPRNLEGGARATCEVWISDSPAPAQVQLMASASELKVPSVINARAHQLSLAFEVAVGSVGAQGAVTLTATLGSTSAEDTILVAPSSSPLLKVSGSQFAKFDTPLSFDVAAIDATGLATQLAAANVPAGAVFDSQSGRFDWTPSASQAGTYRVTFSATNAAQRSATAQVTVDVGSGQPVLDASQSVCSPGAIGTLNGKWLAEPGDVFSNPTGAMLDLGGTAVEVNGGPVPPIAVSQTRIQFVCPNLPVGTQLSTIVRTKAGVSLPANLAMQPASPEIFKSSSPSALNQGQVSFPDTGELASSRTFRMSGYPAQPGDQILIWGTGFAASSEVSPRAISANIGGVDAEVLSVTAVPDQAGVYTVQARVPVPVAFGSDVPIQLQVVGSDGKLYLSNRVTIAVEPVNQ